MNETITFYAVLSAIISACGYVTYTFFKPGGIYNPKPPISPVTPPEVTIPDPDPKQPVERQMEPSTRLYNTAKSFLGEHLTMDNSIPMYLGCAQAVSFVLYTIGYLIPRGGISTVAGLTEWMLANGFKETTEYGVGYVITGRKGVSGHIGVCGKEWIMSNSSYTIAEKNLHQGLWEANYRLPGWRISYPQTRFFVPPDMLV